MRTCCICGVRVLDGLLPDAPGLCYRCDPDPCAPIGTGLLLTLIDKKHKPKEQAKVERPRQ